MRTAGPAFATLVGLALLAGSGRGDIRDITAPAIRQS